MPRCAYDPMSVAGSDHPGYDQLLERSRINDARAAEDLSRVRPEAGRRFLVARLAAYRNCIEELGYELEIGES